MNRLSALGLLLLAAFLWSTGGVLIKSVDWSPMGIAGGRSLIAALVLWMLQRKFHFRMSVAQVGGAIAYAFTVILFVAATRNTATANAIFLQFTAPIYVALFGAVYLGERTTKLDWISIGLAFLGMALFFVNRMDVRGTLGNVFAIASGVSFAWLVLFLRKQKNHSAIESIFLGNCLAAVVCLPFAGGLPADGRSWVLLGLLGTFQLGLSYFFYSKAIPNVTAIEAIMIPFLEPILNPVWVLLLMGERPTKMALVGGTVILSAVLLRAVVPFVWRRGRMRKAA